MAHEIRNQLRGKIRDSYLNLILRFPLVSIKSQHQLQEAQSVLDRLLAEGQLDAGEELYLDALSDLVAAHENEECPIAPASDRLIFRKLADYFRVDVGMLAANF